ncbi:dna cytosine-5--methyltransferase, partial [Trichoderma arundinaceum]
MEANIGSNGAVKEVGNYSESSMAMIHSWRATVSNSDNDKFAPPPSSPIFTQLVPPDSVEGSPEPTKSLASPSDSHHGNSRSGSQKSSTTLLSVNIPECVLLSPRSCYEGFVPPDGMPIMSELKALQTFSPILDVLTADESVQRFAEIRLDDFAIYLDTDKFPEEMRSLHHHNTKLGHSNFFFDGVLSIGESRVYVRRVPVAAVPIGNYGSLSTHTTRDYIWLQSPLSFQKPLFYRLGKPAKEYARFFYPFLWVADLAKHFVDFLCIMGENRRNVSIHHFRSTFVAWLKKRHMESPEFHEWLRQHPSDDFRTSIAANIKFLHKETLGALGHSKAYFHIIWAEVMDFQLFKSQPKIADPPTIVTQYIYDCFEHLPFGDRLQVIPLSSKTAQLRNDLIRQSHLELPSKLHQSSKNLSKAARERIRNIQPGDTISTHRDDVGSGTLWKRELSKGFSDVDRWFALVQSQKSRIRTLRLLRRRQADANAPHARPNELVYTEQTVEVKKGQILNSCSVRCFRGGDEIPTPYNRDGIENLFYITHRQIFIDGAPFYVPLKEAPASLRQGYDPSQKLTKLRGIDLFCGGGNFGRGLEDGGGIEMKWANDYDSKAIHTYMANVSKPEDVHPFLGSIDDLQRFAMQGQFAKNVPHIGDVDFVAGGSPCPGFSCLTNDKTTAAQRKNQSLVAAFASFVDLYRPKYGVLENVPGMVHKREDRHQDVFSQLICALVGLGYQTQFYFLDASSCGSPQRRSRIFVVFAAPGLELPEKPTQTHSHPANTRELGIGWLPNGQH